jgi:hypothetical protein
MQLILAFGLLGLLVIAGGWILRPTAPERLRGKRTGDVVVLRPPRWRNTILAAMAIGPTLLVVVVASAASRRGGLGLVGEIVVTIAVVLGFAVFAYFLAAERRMLVRVDERGVARVGPLREKHVAWGEVRTITYNGVSRWFYLTGPAGIRLWIPENLAGIGDFADLALARVSPAAIPADGATREALEQLVAEAREEDAAGGKVRK